MAPRIPKLPALRLFLEIMRTGTMTGAAERLAMTQSAASRILIGLEKDLELELFRRERQRLVPTRAAQAFYPEAVRVTGVIEEIPRIASTIKADTRLRETVRLLSYPRFAANLIPQALGRTARSDDIRFEVGIESRRDMERWVAASMFDLAVATLPIAHPGVETELIAEFPLSAVIPKGHPLAAKPVITPEELAGEALVLPDRGSLLRDAIGQVLKESETPLDIRFEMRTVEMAARTAMSAGCLSVCDGFLPMPAAGQEMILRRILTSRAIPVGFAIPAGSTLSPGGLTFREILRDVVLEHHQAYLEQLDRKNGTTPS